VKKVGIWAISFTYVGIFLGAGFVSGPELWQFFGAFGNWGYVGFLVSALLFTLFGIILMRLTQMTGYEEMDRLLVPWEKLPWFRKASGVLTAAFLFGIVIIMLAGAGALVEQLFGIPAWLANIVFMALVAVITLSGVTGMIDAFSLLVPILVAATIVFAVAAWAKFGTEAIFQLEYVNTNPLMPNWMVASFTFVAYNLLAGIGIMVPVGNRVEKRSHIYWGISLASLMLVAVAFAIISSMAIYPPCIEAELPMVALAMALNPMLGGVYGIAMLIGMFVNALASLVAMIVFMEQKKPALVSHRKLIVAVSAVLAWAGSLAGFGETISVIFPVFGYLSIVYMVCMVVHFLQLKKREKQGKSADVNA